MPRERHRTEVAVCRLALDVPSERAPPLNVVVDTYIVSEPVVIKDGWLLMGTEDGIAMMYPAHVVVWVRATPLPEKKE